MLLVVVMEQVAAAARVVNFHAWSWRRGRCPDVASTGGQGVGGRHQEGVWRRWRGCCGGGGLHEVNGL